MGILVRTGDVMNFGELRAAENLSTIRSRKFRKNNPRPFVGVDGEGYDDDVLGHIYTLLRAGDKTISNPKGLTTYECLDFLSGLDTRNVYVAFAFNYDVTMILRNLSEYKLTRLVKRELRARKPGADGEPRGIMPLDWWEEFELDWLPGKEFRVRRKGGRWVVINDVWGFFQGTFVAALEKWDIGSESERESISEGKLLRGKFEDIDWGYVEKYNELECMKLAELMDKFRQMCNDAGYVPRKWQGAGQLSEAMMAKHGCPTTGELFEDRWAEVWEYGRRAYNGGRFEIAYVGNISKPVHQYDINSAYPHAMVDPRYPCLAHGEWKRIERGTPISSLNDIALVEGIFHVQDRPDSDYDDFHDIVGFRNAMEYRGAKHWPLYCGLPIRRKDGTIFYPVEGAGWYWSFEVEASIHQKFHVLSGWEYVRRCKCKPMGFIGDVYKQRQRVGKDGQGLVLKTGMNSAYGKKVQSVGSPKYSNPIEGSFITAHCRTRIQELIHSLPECRAGRCGESVVFIATDAVATTRVARVRVSGRLGDWSHDVHESGIFQVQPGLYFGSKGGTSMKTRGIRKSLIKDKRRAFENALAYLMRHDDPIGPLAFDMPDSAVHIPQRRFIGIRLALAQNRLETMCQWPEEYRSITFNWYSKRAHCERLGRNLVRVYPYGKGGRTTPYDKNIGGLDDMMALRQFEDDQPDWAPVMDMVEE